MRSLLLVLLVGCGGGSKQTPPPVSNQAPAATDSKPMVVENTRPACTGKSVTGCVVATLEYFGNQMCACKDKACADRTNEELAAWGTEMAKSGDAGKEEKPDPVLAKKSADVMTKYTECMTKLMMQGAPPPDPCGGATDPCGG